MTRKQFRELDFTKALKIIESSEEYPKTEKLKEVIKKEIEKVLKEGKQLSNEEIIKRMKEAGLPLKIK